jgi:two-component system repressor protein LuxO
MQCVPDANLPAIPVLLVGDPGGALSAALTAARCRVRAVSASDAVTLACRDGGVPVVADEQLEVPSWPALRVRLAESWRFFAVGSARWDSARCVRALRDGAYEVFGAGDDPARIRAAIQRTAAAEALWRRLFESAAAGCDESELLLGRSEAIRRLREQVRRAAPTRATVLVLGESGVGKERVAEALHARSGRDTFIALNCAAIPRDLLEAELFGSVRGAFTGASEDRPGLVEQAEGGTLFLDEVGEMDRALQPKLLRFLETRRARRVGGRADYAVDVRVIAATNADLREGRGFREDLYYRLAEIVLDVPPLRARPEDIPVLCRRFFAAAAERHGKPVGSIEPALIEKLMRWSWPGNVRELRNAVERMVVLLGGPVLGDHAWEPPGPVRGPEADAHPVAARPAGGPLSRRRKRELAFQLLDENSDDYAWVAAQLSIHPTTLYRWRKAAGRI